ncbi:MAG: hypothetical protein LBL07_00440 [Tannerella sp.]|jgi:hypothetical protein|nr:hypothetical protein [Tannerella sp.]
MKLLDLIISLATKCEKQNDPEITGILSRSDLQNIEIADTVANAINNNLLTVEAAKNNLTVKNHFNALALSAVDKEILNAVKSLELGEDFETELSGIKNTYEKQKKLSEKIRESFDSLKAAQGKGDNKDIEKYTKQINDLNVRYAQLKESTVSKTEYDKKIKENENSVRDFMLHSKISGLKFANQDVSQDDNVAFANVILNSRLSKAKAIIVKDGNELKLKRGDDPALDYFDEQNKGVSFDDFMNKAFADAKILAVSDRDKNQSNTGPAQQGQYQFAAPQQGTLNTSKFDAAMNMALNGE